MERKRERKSWRAGEMKREGGEGDGERWSKRERELNRARERWRAKGREKEM